MAKRIIQDIVVSRKQSSQSSSKQQPQDKTKEDKKPDKPKEKKSEEKPKREAEISFPRLKLPRLEFHRSKRKLKFILGFLILVVLVIGGIVVLNKLSSVTVEITPHQESADVNVTLQASVEPQKGELPLEVMQLSRKESDVMQPSGKKQISRKASGQIVIYNAYSSQSQKLISGTRFQTPDGKIYRIDKTIIVPGANVDGGKITASEIDATVYADKPGEEYNGDLTDFVIPGFQDSVKREKIYGRSKTKIEGGFVGEASVVTEDDINSLESSLKEKVKDYLLKMGGNPKADNFLLYDNAKQIVFDEPKNKPKPGEAMDQLGLEESATLFGFLLKKSDINQTLAEKYFSPDIAPRIEIINPEKLSFELKNFASTSITFNLKGQANFAWKIDESDVKNDLIKEKENPNGAFQKYSAIEKAKIVFKPGWWRRIPQNPAKINILLIIK